MSNYQVFVRLFFALTMTLHKTLSINGFGKAFYHLELRTQL